MFEKSIYLSICQSLSTHLYMYLTTIKLVIVIIRIRIITVIIVPLLISAKWTAPGTDRSASPHLIIPIKYRLYNVEKT